MATIKSEINKLTISQFINLSAIEINNYAQNGELSKATQLQMTAYAKANINKLLDLSDASLSYFTANILDPVPDSILNKLPPAFFVRWIKINSNSGDKNLMRIIPIDAFITFDATDINAIYTLTKNINSEKLFRWQTKNDYNLISSLTPELFAAINSKMLNAASQADIQKINPNQISYINPNEISKLNPQFLNALSDDAIKALSNSQIEKITTLTFSKISPSIVNKLNDQQLKSITAEKISSITENNFKFLQAHVINALSSSFGSITKNQIKSLTTDTFSLLDLDVINNISNAWQGIDARHMLAWIELHQSEVKEVNAAIYRRLPNESAQILMLRSLNNLPLDDINLLGPKVNLIDPMAFNKLSIQQIKSIDTIVFSSMSADVISKMNPDFFKYLSYTAMSGLQPNAAPLLSASMLSNLPAYSLKGISAASLGAFNLDQLKALSSTQVASLSSAQISLLSEEQKSILLGKGIPPDVYSKKANYSWAYEKSINLIDVAMLCFQTAYTNLNILPQITLKNFSVFKIVDNPNTGFQAVVYFNPSSNTYILNFQCSNDISDWITIDLAAVAMDIFNFSSKSWANLFTPQLLDALNLYYSIIKQQESAKIIFTGYSLGGGLASALSTFSNNPAIIFNELGVKNSIANDYVVKAIQNWSADKLPDLPKFFTDLYLNSKKVSDIIDANSHNIYAYQLEEEFISLAASLLDSPIAQAILQLIPNYSPPDASWRFSEHATVLPTAYEMNLKNFKDIFQAAINQHSIISIFLSFACPEFDYCVKKLGALTYSDDFKSRLEMLAYEFTEKYNLNEINSSKVFKLSHDLISLVNNSNAWQHGNDLSGGAISAATYCYIYHAPVHPLFSSLANGVVADFSFKNINYEIESNQPSYIDGLSSLRSAFVDRISKITDNNFVIDLCRSELFEVSKYLIPYDIGQIAYRESSALTFAALGSYGAANIIHSGINDAIIVGGQQYNWLYGGDGDDILIGGKSGNLLDGAGGKNILIGGLGSDIFSISEIGEDVIYEFDANSGDVLDLTLIQRKYNADLIWGKEIGALNTIYFEPLESTLHIKFTQDSELTITLIGVHEMSPTFLLTTS